MIIKAQSLDLRHASGTHRVGLGWLSDTINLDCSISMNKMCAQQNNGTDHLTKGAFAIIQW